MSLWWADLRSADVRLADALPAAERARLDELTADADRARRLLGQILVQEALRSARGLPPGATVEIDRTCPDCGAQHGRPVAADGRGPHLSVTHSGLLVAVAACMEFRVGVDVQRIGDPAHPAGWVAREARIKAGPADGAGSVEELAPPLAGYAAALAVAHPGPVTVITRRR